MLYAKFQYCRDLRKEIDRIEHISQARAQSVHKFYDKEEKAKNTLSEARDEYEKIRREIKDWIEASPLAPTYKEAISNYYIKGATIKVNNMERELKRCLGEE